MTHSRLFCFWSLSLAPSNFSRIFSRESEKCPLATSNRWKASPNLEAVPCFFFFFMGGMVCPWWLGLSWFKRRNICQEIMDSMMGGLVLEFLENQCWSNWGCLKLSKHSEENTHLTMLTRNKTYFQHLSTSFNYLPKYFNIFQNQCLLLVVVLTVSLSFSQQQIEKWKLIHAQKLSLTIRFLRQQLVCSVRVQI